MIRTLQATSIVAVVLAGVLFAMTEVRGAHNDENVDRFLNSPGVVERFKELKRNRAATAKDKTPPLVQQAERFKAYLDSKLQMRKSTSVSKTKIAPPEVRPVRHDFKLVGTSFFQGNPEISQALIDQTDKGRHWFRQSGKVGDFIIEQIKDGLVVLRNNEMTFELTLDLGSERNLPMQTFAASVKTANQSHLQSYSVACEETDTDTAKAISAISIPVKYNVAEPMWGEGELNSGLLSYAKPAK